MQKITTPINDLVILEPTVFGDDRGFFMETFRAEWFPEHSFVQDNHSKSVSRTLRGLHYQLTRPQGKLVRVTEGEVYDVGLDLRAMDKAIEGGDHLQEIEGNQAGLEAAGGWGVPSMVFEEELFFGQDRIDTLCWRLDQHGLKK